MRQYVRYEELSVVKKLVEKLPTMTNINEIQDDLKNNYTPVTAMDSYSAQTTHTINELRTKIQDVPSFNQVKFFLSQIEQKINESVSIMAKEEDRKQDKKELVSQLDQFKKFTSDRLSDLDKLKKQYDKIEYEVYQRVQLVVFDKMNSYVSELPTYG